MNDHMTDRQALEALLDRFGLVPYADEPDACVAAEFGDHPDTALPRMLWALQAEHQLAAGAA